MGKGASTARDLLAPPNLVSEARLALVPVAIALLAAGRRSAAVWVLLAMVATDGLDGYLARRLSRVTELGKILDPVADKVAIDSVLAFLAVRGEFPAWAFGLVLARDVGIVAGALWLRRRARSIPAAIRVGKAALVVLAAMTVAYVADLEAVEPWLLAAGVVMVVASSVAYLGVAAGSRRASVGRPGDEDERKAQA